MKWTVPHLNLVVGWLWILLGFGGGAILGLRFHEENWLGGYSSHRRRLYRLGHISFFGLAIINLLFYFTVRGGTVVRGPASVAGLGLVIGAATMPVCCMITAHYPKGRHLFAIPVGSLLAGGLLTLWEIIQL